MMDLKKTGYEHGR